MRTADVFMHDVFAGIFEEIERLSHYRFTYDTVYEGPAISLTLPVRKTSYEFNEFPAFLEGLLRESKRCPEALQF